jgi:hypothetical protein
MDVVVKIYGLKSKIVYVCLWAEPLSRRARCSRPIGEGDWKVNV